MVTYNYKLCVYRQIDNCLTTHKLLVNKYPHYPAMHTYVAISTDANATVKDRL